MLHSALNATHAFPAVASKRPGTLLFCDTRRLSHPNVVPGLRECTQTLLARAKPLSSTARGCKQTAHII